MSGESPKLAYATTTEIFPTPFGVSKVSLRLPNRLLASLAPCDEERMPERASVRLLRSRVGGVSAILITRIGEDSEVIFIKDKKRFQIKCLINLDFSFLSLARSTGAAGESTIPTLAT